jgi:streptogramin lyase
MGRDRDGNILVIEPHYQRVNHYAPDGSLVAQWGCKGTQAGCFTLPRAVAVNSRGEFFVSEYMGEERVQRFALPVQSLKSEVLSPESRVQSQALTPALSPSDGRGGQQADAPRLLQVIGYAGTGPGEFNRPEGICVDAQDRLYVADSCNHRIQIFSSDGKFIRAYGKAGSGKGELSYPYDIAVDADGNQFVCEFGNSRIQVFDANCEPVEIIGGPGAEPGRFANPWAVALDSHGNLYVADSQNHRVQKLIRSPKSKAQSLKSPDACETAGLQALDFRL